MAETQTYGHDEIQRYLQHKMTPQEMHDFEKALMNDPFLADALEGFSAGDVAVTERHLAEMENQLTGEKQKGKVVPLPVQKTAWWKVAAVILVVAGGGVLTYSSLTKKSIENRVAQHPDPAEAAKIVAKTDSIGPVEKPLAKVDILPEKKFFNRHKTGSPIIREEKPAAMANMQMKTDSPAIAMMDKRKENLALMNNNADVVSPINAHASSAAEFSLFSKKMTASLDLPQNKFKGKIVDMYNHPLAGAAISISQNNIKAIPDSNGNFSLKDKDSILQIMVSAANYLPKDVTIKSDSPANIVLNKASPSLSEVVVKMLTEKKKESGFKQLKEKTANDAEPIDGWKNFEQYVIRQTDSIKANDPAYRYNENIELEFSIDDTGRPFDIKAVQNTDSITAEKAAKILNNGPKWRNATKDKKVKVIIPFNRNL